MFLTRRVLRFAMIVDLSRRNVTQILYNAQKDVSATVYLTQSITLRWWALGQTALALVCLLSTNASEPVHWDPAPN